MSKYTPHGHLISDEFGYDAVPATRARCGGPGLCKDCSVYAENIRGQYATSTFVEELQRLINKHSMENGSNTPDYVLANYMKDCLDAFNRAISTREHFYGVHNQPGQVSLFDGTVTREV